jgi:uncharacterized protein YqjF (DUF2071 family)
MMQRWTDVVFVHWETDPDAARVRLPAGVDLDRFSGRTFVGLVALRIDVALLGRPVPRVGSFAEVNVRLYSVDRAGRRGVTFCSMDAGRLAPAVAGRVGLGLPYAWADADLRREGDVASGRVRRRWPGTGSPSSRFTVRIGERVARPGPLEHFLTARWALHWAALGRTWWCPVEHEPWVLHTATMDEIDDELVAAAGLPLAGRPLGVLWSPGARTRIDIPRQA